MKGFLENFYNYDEYRGKLVSEEAFNASWNIAVGASAIATVACIPTWETDFREDLERIDVPILVIDGDADRVLPYEKTGKRLPGMMSNLELVTIEGGPHAIAWTHTPQVNDALLHFISADARAAAQ